MNLPVVDNDDEIVGMMDVLKLTYSTLNTISSIKGDKEGENQDPIWKNFWGSSFSHDGSRPGSALSGSYRQSSFDNVPEVYPHESISAANSPTQASEKFDYKVNVGKKKVYRINGSSHSLKELSIVILERLRTENVFLDKKFVPSLSYIDDENDAILLTNDQDLSSATLLARKLNWNRLKLILNNPPDEITSPTDNEFPSIILQSPTPIPDMISNKEKSGSVKDLVPDHMVVPVALGVGFMVAALGATLIVKLSK